MLFGDAAVDAAMDVLQREPERAALAAFVGMLGDSETNAYWLSYTNMMPGKNTNYALDMIYEILGALGYGMSDGEKALRDGTHPAYTGTMS